MTPGGPGAIPVLLAFRRLSGRPQSGPPFALSLLGDARRELPEPEQGIGAGRVPGSPTHRSHGTALPH